jgi:branched-subunit amino acid aminotransferase/4-amino-4-deoxychorismate lyase
MKGGYILINGKFHPEHEPSLKGSDFEKFLTGIQGSFRTENNEILFATENYYYLVDHLTNAGLSLPPDWDLSRFRKDVSRLLNKNHFFLAARVNLYLYKDLEKISYILSAEEIERGFYPLNETGLLIDFYEGGLKNHSPLDAYESSSRYLWRTALQHMILKQKQNLLISNPNGVCEGIEVSFGFFKEKILYLPSRQSGGYYPPLISKIAKSGEECKFQVQYLSTISKEDLLEADEVFLIDNCLGIQKVLGLNSRRYYSTNTILLANAFKETAVRFVKELNSV